MIFECFGDSDGLLNFEYINEVGEGLGPTLEYYTLVVKELRKLGNKMWRPT